MNPTTTSTSSALAKFEQSLRAVIAMLDDASADVATLERVFAQLTRGFDEMRASTSTLPAPGAELARLAALNAVAQQLAGQRLAHVAEHIALTRQVQQVLDRSGATDDTGAYCDVER